ncbi:nitronate monooxygenase [Kineosporia succinea]|uniref:NAD(P)H-dependent flavin oxidoreductase YrpB (Nitropropane dioxygenase family) n=1 Tax=Kineosporia succinea TaxID=84632 RepID=A0ABT9P247_9ACTN|nr:nitronate monooxygenase [Kineosporia succinea]MDP9826746.1 NAD(P)H-dependent flavin oxidoreductase YrpB (nitropropane dioxygenase family) [Kineosporia succinea]
MRNEESAPGLDLAQPGAPTGEPALPVVIQGGMGAAVSDWNLARQVAMTGNLGVVSGTALDTVVARRLQDGDPGGHMRRALAHFPVPEVAERILDRYFNENGREEGKAYLPVPNLTLKPVSRSRELMVASAFVEVWLAKEGHDGPVGINLLEKIQLAMVPSLYGSMLAGVDYVLVGAGIPSKIPRLLDKMARHEQVAMEIHVDESTQTYATELNPYDVVPENFPPLKRPKFLAIIASHPLAAYLTKEEATTPDGFVVEGHIAGGHNAPPRGRMTFADNGEPVYGTRDEADIPKIAKFGLPFWLAGAYATPELVQQAIAQGAVGVQVGTIFALSSDSGTTPENRGKLLDALAADRLEVRTDALASPTGFPFKVVPMDGTLGEQETYLERTRICDLAYLRTAYEKKPGQLGYRCPSEPEDDYVRKGGELSNTVGRKCLCNGLMATIGMPQVRSGIEEGPLLTLGSDLTAAKQLLNQYPDGWDAQEAVRYLLSGAEAAPEQELAYAAR